jgi:transcriptional regulator with XRE-family HTH domain
MKKIIIDFKAINKQCKALNMSKAELARRVGKEKDTLHHFLNSGKKLTDHINLIKNICKELDLDWRNIIK